MRKYNLLNLIYILEMVSTLEKKKNLKSNDTDATTDASGNTVKKNKGLKPYLINLLKKLIYLIIFSFISLGILMSTQIKNNIKSKIPDLVQDFSNSSKQQNIPKSMKKTMDEVSPVLKWLSTTYNNTFETDNNIYKRINELFGSLFSISITNNKSKEVKEGGAQILFSMIFTTFYFFLSPILALINSSISSVVNFIAPFYFNYEHANLLFDNYNFIIAIITYIIFQYINLFSDSVTGIVGFWGTLTMMVFEPYLYNFLAVARQYIDPKNPDTEIITNLINVLLSDDKVNYNYWKTKGVPMIKKIAPVLVNLFLIYAAISSNNYLSNSVTYGLWAGIVLINIPLIISLIL